MSEYEVHFLGTPWVKKDGEAVRFPYRKAEGIFYYLCMRRVVNRDEVISVFWGGFEEAVGRKNFRQALYQIRKILGDDVVLVRGQQRVELNPEISLKTDWEPGGEAFATCHERFLNYFYLKGCMEFEEWVSSCQDEQKRRCLEYIREQLPLAAEASDTKRLHDLLDSWLQWEPWNEEAVISGMTLYTGMDQYTLALQLYYDYEKRLQEELDEKPGEELRRTFDTVFRMKEVAMNRTVEHGSYFYGRTKELEKITVGIQSFCAGNAPKSILIVGDSGVGKSALIEHARSINRGTDILDLTSHCYRSEQNFPLKGWRGMFKRIEKMRNSGQILLSPESTSVIPRIFTGNLRSEGSGDAVRWNAESEYPALEDGIIRMFHEIAETRKIVFYFDDIHWMDPISQQLLQRVILEMGSTEVYLVATCTLEDKKNVREMLNLLGRWDRITEISLSSFSEEETAQIMGEVLKGFESPLSPAEMYRRTEGNAMILMDLLRMIREGKWREGLIPPQTESVIQSTLDNLSENEMRVLNALSMYIEHAEIFELEALLDMSEMELFEILEKLEKKQLIQEKIWGSYVVYLFRHQAMKEYVYNHQSIGKRRAWHRTIAECYESLRNGARWLELLPFTIQQYELAGDQKKADALRRQFHS